MTEWTHSPTTSWLGSEFNAFLFASIDEGASEAPLSVVSALARLDLDPWQEAAELTQLPKETAAQRLAALLATLPGGEPVYLDARTIASRLVGLLPDPAGPAIRSSRPPGSKASVQIETAEVVMLFIAISVITMVVLGLGNQPVPASAKFAPASAPGATVPTVSPTKLQR